MDKTEYAGRAGEKLAAAISGFGISVRGKVVADFGSSVGGFVDCLLRAGARKVYAVETGYGVLDYQLRKDSRVVVMERTNAMYVTLAEKVDLVTIDAGWTRQEKIIPNAVRQLTEDGKIVTLVKPHYEARRDELSNGVLKEDKSCEVLGRVIALLEGMGMVILGEMKSPILGAKGGNVEYLVYLALKDR